MYNIGGDESSHSVMRSYLSSNYASKWEFMNLPNYNFENYSFAFVVEDKIVYFGWNNKDATFVLEQEEESDQLKVVRED